MGFFFPPHFSRVEKKKSLHEKDQKESLEPVLLCNVTAEREGNR